MSVAEANEILFSEEAYQQFGEMTPGIAGNFVGYRGVVVKHGLTLTVYQYINRQLKYLNSTRSQTRGSVVVAGQQAQAPAKVNPTTGSSQATVPQRSSGGKVRVRRSSAVSPVCQEILDRLVSIPAGTFLAGGQREAAEVGIRRGFMIDRFPMTQDLYRQVTSQCECQFKGDKLPVDSVNWFEAVAFCNALSRMCERGEVYRISAKDVAINYDANGFRLPTEAEWEYACGNAGLDGNDAALTAVAWFTANARQTESVGQLKPNANGLFDMLGNVWEWCNDWYAKRAPNTDLTDPVGPAEGIERVLRGGSWNDLASSVSSTYRSRRDPSQHSTNVGFRIAMTNTAKAGRS